LKKWVFQSVLKVERESSGFSLKRKTIPLVRRKFAKATVAVLGGALDCILVFTGSRQWKSLKTGGVSDNLTL